MQHRRPLFVAAALLAATFAAPAAADVKAGVDAWKAGNFTAAVAEWRPIADKGDADAQFNMGQAYRFGKGVPKDLRITQSWYEKAAQQGHEKAQANLGILLFDTGKRAEALPWIRKAADRGDPRALYVLGTAHFNGDLVAKDWPRAYAMMTRASAAGLPPAAQSLAQMDKYLPAADRQKGIALARQMETGVATTAATPKAPPPKPARVAGAATAKTSVPAPKAAAPAPKAAAPVAKTATPAPKAAAKPAAPAGRWRVQLGAYSSTESAREQWAAASRKIAALKDLQPSYEPAGKLTRLRVGPLADKAAAERVCASVKAAGQGCFTVAP
jgi:TPR repeat protein